MSVSSLFYLISDTFRVSYLRLFKQNQYVMAYERLQVKKSGLKIISFVSVFRFAVLEGRGEATDNMKSQFFSHSVNSLREKKLT